MQWEEKWLIGIGVIDAQHRQLLRLGAELHEGLTQGMDQQALQRLLDSARIYIHRHYVLEERYMEQVAYPGLSRQVEMHRAFSARLEALAEEYAEQGISRDLLGRVNSELSRLMAHITGPDQEFGRFWRARTRDDS